MDRIAFYQETIKRLLSERHTNSQLFLPKGLDVTRFFDDESKQYALMSIGWQKDDRVNGTILLLRIKNGKIWIEEDNTSAPIDEDLLEAGVPAEDIVLAFASPEPCPLTEFAVA